MVKKPCCVQESERKWQKNHTIYFFQKMKAIKYKRRNRRICSNLVKFGRLGCQDQSGFLPFEYIFGDLFMKYFPVTSFDIRQFPVIKFPTQTKTFINPDAKPSNIQGNALIVLLGTEEIQFMPELWRFEREKGGWEPQSTVVRKESEELLPPLYKYWALGFLSSLFPLKPPEFRHKLNFFGPPL